MHSLQVHCCTPGALQHNGGMANPEMKMWNYKSTRKFSPLEEEKCTTIRAVSSSSAFYRNYQSSKG